MTNKQSNDSGTRSGISVLGLLGVAFVVLKLTGFISWSWWWVTVPFWGPLAIVIVICLLCALAIGVIEIFEKSKERRKR